MAFGKKLSRRDFLSQTGSAALGVLSYPYHFIGKASFPYLQDESEVGFGPLIKDPEQIMDLPEDFSYKIIARSGEKMTDGFYMPRHPDGMGTFEGPDGLTPDDLSRAMTADASDFNLHFRVLDLDANGASWTTCDCEPFVITTRGPDRKGLVANITALLAAHNVNVTQLQAAFRGGDDPDKNIMIYEVDIPLDIDQKKLREALQDKGKALNLQINIQHKSIFEAINRI